MQKLKIPLFSRRLKLSLIGIALVVIACSALVWAATTASIPGNDLTNSGIINPATGSTASPLLMVRDDSVQTAISQGNNESALVEITDIPWGNVYSSSDSFKALGNCTVDLYNNDSATTIYPSWSVTNLPTGLTLTAYVEVYVDQKTDVSGNLIGFPTCNPATGVAWAENDAKMFYLPPKDMATTSLMKIDFVLGFTTQYSAVAQQIRFVISFSFTLAT
jgi:hypothetical protein